jgi:N-methylhydantoinase B
VEERDIHAPGRFEMKAGATFVLQTAGGGGYGDPQNRDLAAIARDHAEGYGVAVKDGGRES